jgi:hypothetical protein
MRKPSLLITVSIIALIFAAPAFAEKPAQDAEQTLAPEMIQTTAEKPVVKGVCDASVTCWDGSPVSCSGNNTCTAVDSNCPWERGYVKCDGNYTYCPDCPFCRLQGRLCKDDDRCTSLPECAHCWCDFIEPGIGICYCP